MKPRGFLATPSHFGRFFEVQWHVAESEAERDALRAAQWQHQVAVLANAALTFREWTRDDLAQQIGRERQYIWDRLQGHTPMSLRDFAALERLLGVQIVAPDSDVPMPIEMQVAPADE